MINLDKGKEQEGEHQGYPCSQLSWLIAYKIDMETRYYCWNYACQKIKQAILHCRQRKESQTFIVNQAESLVKGSRRGTFLWGTWMLEWDLWRNHQDSIPRQSIIFWWRKVLSRSQEYLGWRFWQSSPQPAGCSLIYRLDCIWQPDWTLSALILPWMKRVIKLMGWMFLMKWQLK